MPIAVWARLAARDDGVLRFVGQPVQVKDYADSDLVSDFKLKALTALGKPANLASSVEIVEPCDEDAEVQDFLVVLKKVTLPIGPVVGAFVNGATDKNVFFLLRPDATTCALACGAVARPLPVRASSQRVLCARAR